MQEWLLEFFASNFSPTSILMIITVLSLVAILKLGIKFDLNAFIQARKQRHYKLACLNCPHMKFVQVNGQEISYQSLFYSPVGTLDWICEQCGTVIHAPLSDKEIKSKAEYYMAHYREYKKQMKRFEKHARKSL